MSTLRDCLSAHRPRIDREIVDALMATPTAFTKGQTGRVLSLVSACIDALVSRVESTSHPDLEHLIRSFERSPGGSIGAAATTLVRVSAAIRSVLFREVKNRRIAATASAAIDRVVAEVLTTAHRPDASTQTMTVVGPSPLYQKANGQQPAPVATLDDVPDPTMIRNIKEILGDDKAERVNASLVAANMRFGKGSAPKNLSNDRRTLSQLSKDAESRGGRLAIAHGGLVVVAFPDRIDGDDISDALSWALSVQSQYDSISIGVSRGEVIFEDGKDNSREALGEPFTMSLGLSALAQPKEILVDTPAAQAATAYSLRPHTDHEGVHRLDIDQPLWLDRWEQAALVSTPPFVGYDGPRHQLTGWLRGSKRKVSVVAVRGRAGSGRSTLVSNALSDLSVPRERVLWLDPHPIAAVPYWPLLEFARQAASLDERPSTGSELIKKIEELATTSASTAPLRNTVPTLKAMLGSRDDLDLDDDPGALSIGSAVTLAMGMLLETYADKVPDAPLYLVVRELQLLDSPSADVLGEMLQRYRGTAPIVLIVTYRGQIKLPVSWRTHPRQEVAVTGLSGEEIMELARGMLDQQRLPSSIASLLKERSDGSPMGAAQIVRFLAEQGWLIRRAGEWELNRPIAASSFPKRLTSLVELRVAGLPLHLSQLLKALATAGHTLPKVMVELIWVSLGLTHDEVEKNLRLLEQMGFLSLPHPARVEFSHLLVQDVAYRMQSSSERRVNHRWALVAVKGIFPDALQQFPSLVFRHAVACESLDDIRESALAAARRSNQLQDHKHGLSLIGRALELLPEETAADRAAKFDILSCRERLLDTFGGNQKYRSEQTRDLEQMIELAETAGDPIRQGAAFHRSARLYLLAGDIQRAEKFATAAVERLSTEHPIDRANALRTLALVKWRARELDEAGRALQQALGLYEAQAHYRGMGFVLYNLGLFALDSGATSKARRYLARAFRIKTQTDDTAGRASVLEALGQVARQEGNTADAIESLDAALRLKSPLVESWQLAATQVSLAEAVLETDADRAEELARSAIQSTRRRKSLVRNHIAALIVMTQASIQQGEKAKASRALKQAHKLLEGLDLSLLLVRCLVTEADLHLLYRSKTRSERAMVAADRASEVALKLGALRWGIEAQCRLARAWQRLDQHEAARIAQQVQHAIKQRDYAGLDVAKVQATCEAVLTSGTTSPS